MIKKYYRDFYGCTASIKEQSNGFLLTIKATYGILVHKKEYSTFRGARIAMGKLSDVWREITK